MIMLQPVEVTFTGRLATVGTASLTPSEGRIELIPKYVDFFNSVIGPSLQPKQPKQLLLDTLAKRNGT